MAFFFFFRFFFFLFLLALLMLASVLEFSDVTLFSVEFKM